VAGLNILFQEAIAVEGSNVWMVPTLTWIMVSAGEQAQSVMEMAALRLLGLSSRLVG
jgi:hypothetical protein